jgi:hypothetical protein
MTFSKPLQWPTFPTITMAILKAIILHATCIVVGALGLPKLFLF